MVYYNYKIPRLFPVSAQVAGEHLEKLKQRDGFLTGKSVLDSGRPEDSPIHSCFDWNDNTAAEKYRLSQANDLIRSIVVAMPQEEDKAENQKVVRAFLNVESENKNGAMTTGIYISSKEALSQEETRKIVVGKALNELKIFRTKYENLSELAGVFAEIDKIIE